MNSDLERLAALEERVANIRDQIAKISDRTDEVYALMQRGKGAKWMVIALATLISWIMGVVAHKIVPNLLGSL